MATTPKAEIRKPSKGNPWMPQPPGLAETMARSAGDFRERATSSWREFIPWWHAQTDHLRLALVVVALVAVISLLNLTAAGLGRLGTSQTATAQTKPATVAATPAARTLTAEAPPIIPGKAWVATQLWQGSNSRVTEAFTVGTHWRVDWLYNPPTSGGIFQVFIYSADGALLMDMAANTQKAGPDSSFWVGPGSYFLKVNSTGGDWKLDVQDLH
ncbi:MAG: hypothetical protein QOH08_682 [Chloroflexota bacterium]|nr:hypothetical protein [Chloroflexota bacterium]